MDYRYLKMIGWTMLGAGVGLMSVANGFAIENKRANLRERADKLEGTPSA